jgi:hypothetical protein
MSAECSLQVDKILSENYLYRPWNRRLVLSSEVRAYKSNIEELCDDNGFYEFLRELTDRYPNLVLKSEYNFNVPARHFFFSSGDVSGMDLTNMVKAVEDSLLGGIIDDKYVIETLLRKNPSRLDFYSIVANFQFFKYSFVHES